MRLIFMGTPEFARPALQALIDSPDHEVVAVYTQPPRPAGRGHKEQPSPVHQLAQIHSIPVRTPTSLKALEVQAGFAAWHADASIVAAYGLLLPSPILTVCRYGCINIHPSLLPRWRGAAPIQRTIIAGDTETGIGIMQMDKGLDTGDVLSMEHFTIPEQCTAGQLHDLLAKRGAELLLKTLKQLSQGHITPTPQSEEGVTYAQKITKDDGRIDWNHSAHTIACQIRGLNPWPGAYFSYQGEKIKILEATEDSSFSASPGTIQQVKQGVRIACSEGSLVPTVVQRPGRAAMPIDAMLRGYAIPDGTILPSTN